MYQHPPHGFLSHFVGKDVAVTDVLKSYFCFCAISLQLGLYLFTGKAMLYIKEKMKYLVRNEKQPTWARGDAGHLVDLVSLKDAGNGCLQTLFVICYLRLNCFECKLGSEMSFLLAGKKAFLQHLSNVKFRPQTGHIH